MRTPLRSIALSLCVSVVPACSHLQHPAPTRQATGFRPATIELGAQPWHASVPFSSRWDNHLGERAIVAAVRASCNCTDINPNAYVGRTIEAGDSLEIAARLDTGGRPGRHSAEVQLMLASGAIYVLTIDYETVATYTVLPERLRFERVRLDIEDDDSDAVQTLVFRSDTAALLGNPTSNVPWLEAAVAEGVGNEAQISVHVVKRYLPHGRNTAMLTVNTTDPYRPRFTIPVDVEGVAALRAVPGHAFLDAERRGEAIVRLVDAEGRRARIRELTADSPDIKLVKRIFEGELLVMLNPDARSSASGPYIVRVTDEAGNRTRFFVSIVRPERDPNPLP